MSQQKIQKRRLDNSNLAGICTAAMLLAGGVTAQQVTIQSSASTYISANRVPSPVRAFLIALGSRLERPGKERTTLTGQYKDSNAAVPIVLTWEIPGLFRIDRGDRPGAPLFYDNVKGANNGNPLDAVDANALESLFEDSPESVLYGFQQNVSARFLGNHFRADDGKTPNYTGPWFDIYELRLKSKTQPGSPGRTKLCYFDSTTGWLAKVSYLTTPNIRVTTEFSGWAKAGSDAFPQKIIRTEAGATVFTINITQAVAGPAIVADGVFPGH